MFGKPMIYRKAIPAKEISTELNNVLLTSIIEVYYIKMRLLKS